MESVTSIRSFEELQFLVTTTFEALARENVKANEKGGWLIHILEKEDKLYVRNANLEKVLAIVKKQFAEQHEEREMGIRTIKSDFKKLGIIQQTNASRKFTPIDSDGIELGPQNCKVTVINLLAVNWIIDSPLLSSDTKAKIGNEARKIGQKSWLNEWLEKV